MPGVTPAPAVRVIGESLIDVVLRPDGQERHPGGSPMNVAYGLGRLGVDTELLTHLARDEAGAGIAEHLATAGVRIDPASYGAAATSTATVRIRGDGAAEYDFDIVWELPTPAGLRPAEWTHIGSIATVLEPGAGQLEAALPTLGGDGILSFDPNVRPALVPPHADSLARIERFTASADVVKMSDEDAEWLYPGLSLDAVLDRMLALGCRLVAITRGGDGVRLAAGPHRVDVPAPRVAVVDTIGAGDSFMSALIWQLSATGFELDADALTELGRTCGSAAAITVSRAGAQPPTLSELGAA